jgi:hypothetical protein
LRKDIEDNHRAIDDRQGHDLLEVRALPRAQIVENEKFGCVERLGERGDFVRLPASDHRGRIDAVEPLDDAANERSAGSFDQRFELRKFRFERPLGIVQIDCDHERALGGGRDGISAARHANAVAR